MESFKKGFDPWWLGLWPIVLRVRVPSFKKGLYSATYDCVRWNTSLLRCSSNHINRSRWFGAAWTTVQTRGFLLKTTEPNECQAQSLLLRCSSVLQVQALLILGGVLKRKESSIWKGESVLPPRKRMCQCGKREITFLIFLASHRDVQLISLAHKPQHGRSFISVTRKLWYN